jgi:hypothetical protein
MAAQVNNTPYRKGPDNTWFNQNMPGGPTLMYVQLAPDGISWTYNLQWSDILYQNPAHVPTQAQAQTNLDAYAAQLNAGTA